MNKKWFCIASALTVLLLLTYIALPAPVIAEEKGCSFQGSWYGDPTDGIAWIVNVQGSSQASGTSDLETPGFDPTLSGYFPNAVKGTSLKGVWERIGGNTFAMSLIGLGVDEFGQTEWIAKMSGTTTLGADCNSEMLTLTVEFFESGDDPYEDEPFLVMPLPVHPGYRILVTPSPM